MAFLAEQAWCCGILQYTNGNTALCTELVLHNLEALFHSFFFESGYIIICGAGEDALLSVLTNKKVNLGYMLLMMTRVARRIESVL